MNTLTGHGYTIEKADASTGIILTDLTPLSRGSKRLVHRLRVISKDSSIQVAGEYPIYLVNRKGDVVDTQWRILGNRGFSAQLRTFRWIDGVCVTLPGCKEYQKIDESSYSQDLTASEAEY